VASLPAASSCLRQSAVDRRQGGGAELLLMACLQRRKRGGKERAGGVGDAFYQRGGRQGKQGGRGGVHVEERDRRREGGPSVAVDSPDGGGLIIFQIQTTSKCSKL
jgi:hypothetical protein